jgi:hypothetical protein
MLQKSEYFCRAAIDFGFSKWSRCPKLGRTGGFAKDMMLTAGSMRRLKFQSTFLYPRQGIDDLFTLHL